MPFILKSSVGLGGVRGYDGADQGVTVRNGHSLSSPPTSLVWWVQRVKKRLATRCTLQGMDASGMVQQPFTKSATT